MASTKSTWTRTEVGTIWSVVVHAHESGAVVIEESIPVICPPKWVMRALPCSEWGPHLRPKLEVHFRAEWNGRRIALSCKEHTDVAAAKRAVVREVKKVNER